MKLLIYSAVLGLSFLASATQAAPSRLAPPLPVERLLRPPGQITLLGALGMGKLDATGRRIVTHTQFLEAGKTYTITVNEPFEALLGVSSPEGKILADTLVAAKPMLIIPVTVSGNYQILVTSQKAGVAGGTYTVTIAS